MNYFDAHNHLHDKRLLPHREAILEELHSMHVVDAVVNGTTECDWDAVDALGFGRPSYGLHPWYVNERSNRWLPKLRERLQNVPGAAIGEVGLDRWIEGHDLSVQVPVFAAQLNLAAEFSRPVTIHCIRAWGALLATLQSHDLPRGFLLHAYGGPEEMVDAFIHRGAYFSFSPSFLQDRKRVQREVFRHLPIDRILIETDAPDLRPPDDHNPRPLAAPDGTPINHPGNISVAYEALAEVRGVPVNELADVIAENFRTLFVR